MRNYLLVIFCFVYSFSFGQDSTTTKDLSSKEFTIGVFETPPFVTESPNGMEGISLKSWKMANEKLQWDYKFKKYSSLGELINGVEKGEVDFSINPITVTDKRMQRVDFSQPYFISNTGIAKKSESPVLKILSNLWSWKFLSAILVLLFILLIFGTLVWFFERHKNEEFGGKGVKGIYEGLWWSAVTMTTVGYGDKSPRTTGGRVVGLIWMFMAVIILSSLTAGIASALTVQSISSEINSIDDLNKFKIATVENSSSQELLDLYQVDYVTVENGAQGIKNLLDKEYMFVYDIPILQYEVKEQELEGDIEILDRSLKKDYFSYSFPKNSILVNEIDQELISVLKTMEWSKVIENY